jgi:hypothetical protein
MPAAVSAAGVLFLAGPHGETRGVAALLTMRVSDLILRSIARAMRLEG